MNMTTTRKRMLLDMKDDIVARLKEAQADLDAVERLIVVQKAIEPLVVPSSAEDIRQGAIDVLKDNGDPMHRRDILDCLVERGIDVGGKVAVNNLGAILSRFGDDFVPHGQGMWGLKVTLLSANGHHQDPTPL